MAWRRRDMRTRSSRGSSARGGAGADAAGVEADAAAALAVPAAMAAVGAGLDLICPQKCGPEAAWASDLSIAAAPDLMSLLTHLRGGQLLPQPRPELLPPSHDTPDMADLKGQETARRVLEIAAAGMHNLLMVGPPGAGKSMLAARLPGLLPPLSPREALDVTMLHSVAGQLPAGGLIQTRPFRDPHHSASMAALVGGGARARPAAQVLDYEAFTNSFILSWSFGLNITQLLGV